MAILYKYVSSDRALTCIPEVGDGTLRATQPAALNDPFECAVMTPYIFPNEAEENRDLADVLTRINESKPVTEEDVEGARKNTVACLRVNCSRSRFRRGLVASHLLANPSTL